MSGARHGHIAARHNSMRSIGHTYTPQPG
uniref:Uncharacterized protein n=1 Tax=Arundo donax TaxID=35708 RepID=A0A0A8YEH5_ARUDO